MIKLGKEDVIRIVSMKWKFWDIGYYTDDFSFKEELKTFIDLFYIEILKLKVVIKIGWKLFIG